MAHLADFDTRHQFHARVKNSQRLTPADTDEIREIVLEVQEPGFTCAVDEGIGVLVSTTDDFGTREHHRLYSIADLPERTNGKALLTLLVKRCDYVDDFSGEKHDGVASNFLCDRQPGDEITITGPHRLPFEVPDDHSANLILIGMGTGIAPFRAFVKHIYKNVPDWSGQIRLFYGARSGLELLYLNDKDGDLTQYYDKDTFEAFRALSPRPHWSDPIALDEAIQDRATEVMSLLAQSSTRVYVAGYEKVSDLMDKAFAKILGSREQWETRKAELKAGGKWAEIIY